jgi:hypothetical protein
MQFKGEDKKSIKHSSIDSLITLTGWYEEEKFENEVSPLETFSQSIFGLMNVKAVELDLDMMINRGAVQLPQSRLFEDGETLYPTLSLIPTVTVMTADEYLRSRNKTLNDACLGDQSGIFSLPQNKRKNLKRTKSLWRKLVKTIV